MEKYFFLEANSIFIRLYQWGDEMKPMFVKWKEKYQIERFIEDGVVDEGSMDQRRILFVLREMNTNEERDLCEDLRRNGSSGKTWNNAARWIKVLLEQQIDLSSLSSSQRAQVMKKAAVMNLKKEAGKAKAIPTEIRKTVQMQHQEIYDQIVSCRPDVIICCGLGHCSTAELLKDTVFPVSSKWTSIHSERFDREWSMYSVSLHEKTVPVLSFPHPQLRQLEKKRGTELMEALCHDLMMIDRQVFI